MLRGSTAERGRMGGIYTQRVPVRFGHGPRRAVGGEPRDSQKFFGSFFQKRTKEKVLLFEKRSKNFCLLIDDSRELRQGVGGIRFG
jgi:hypothetical protein